MLFSFRAVATAVKQKSCYGEWASLCITVSVAAPVVALGQIVLGAALPQLAQCLETAICLFVMLFLPLKESPRCFRFSVQSMESYH